MWYHLRMTFNSKTAGEAGRKAARQLGPEGRSDRARRAAIAGWKHRQRFLAKHCGLKPRELLAMLRATLPDKAGSEEWQEKLIELRKWLEAE